MEGTEKAAVPKSGEASEEKRTGEEDSTAAERKEALCLFTRGKRHRPAGLRRREPPPDVTQSVEFPRPSTGSDAEGSSGTGSSKEVSEEDADLALMLPTKRHAGTSLQTAKAIEAIVQQRKQREQGGESGTAAAGTALESMQYAASGSTAAAGTADSRATAPDLLRAEDTLMANRKVNRLPGTGPNRPITNVRTTSVMDYQPDLCKDYAETGYCGFGDNCKFLHDRGDYKSGWQIDREWEAEQASKACAALGVKQRGTSKKDLMMMHTVEAEDAYAAQTEAAEAGEGEFDGEDIPFACLKCRKKWGGTMKPVQTRCGHVFCEDCLLLWFRKHSVCPYCKQACGKFYNTPSSLIARIQQLREEAQSAAAAEAADSDPYDASSSRASERQDVRAGGARKGSTSID